MITHRALSDYFMTLQSLLLTADATNSAGQSLRLESACKTFFTFCRHADDNDNKIVFVGNGGSAAIASHMAIDYLKAGNMRAMAFNDAAALTCLGNDLGYERVFSRQMAALVQDGDVVVAISSSGKSPNILTAAAAACGLKSKVVTFSGFKADNPLRAMGDLNFWIDSTQYGFVEIAHLALLHAVLDLSA